MDQALRSRVMDLALQSEVLSVVNCYSVFVYNSRLSILSKSEPVNKESEERVDQELAHSVLFHVVEESMEFILLFQVLLLVIVNEGHENQSDETEENQSFSQVYPVEVPVLGGSSCVVSQKVDSVTCH